MPSDTSGFQPTSSPCEGMRSELHQRPMFPLRSCEAASGIRTRPTSLASSRAWPLTLRPLVVWTQQGLNLRPPACEADALPTELCVRVTGRSPGRPRRSLYVLDCQGSMDAVHPEWILSDSNRRSSACKADAFPDLAKDPMSQVQLPPANLPMRARHPDECPPNSSHPHRVLLRKIFVRAPSFRQQKRRSDWAAS
jgi:hypothetical protein